MLVPYTTHYNMEFAIKKAVSRLRYVLYTGRDWTEPLLHEEKDEAGADLDQDRAKELEEMKQLISLLEEKRKTSRSIPDTQIDTRVHLSVIPESDEQALELFSKDLLVSEVGDKDLKDLEHLTEGQSIQPVFSKSPTQIHRETVDIVTVSLEPSHPKSTYSDAPEPKSEALDSQRSSQRVDTVSDRKDDFEAEKKVESQFVKPDYVREEEIEGKGGIIAEVQSYVRTGIIECATRTCASGEVSPEPFQTQAVPVLGVASLLFEEEPVWALGIITVNPTSGKRVTEEEKREFSDPGFPELTDDAYKLLVIEGEMEPSEAEPENPNQREVFGTALYISDVDRNLYAPGNKDSVGSIPQVPAVTDDVGTVAGNCAGPDLSANQNPSNQSVAVLLVPNEPETFQSHKDEQVPELLENAVPVQSQIIEIPELLQVSIVQEGSQRSQEDRKDEVSAEPKSSDSSLQGEEPALLETQRELGAIDTVLETDIVRRSEELENSRDSQRKNLGGSGEMHIYAPEEPELIDPITADHPQGDDLARDIEIETHPINTLAHSDVGDLASSLPQEKSVKSDQLPLAQEQNQGLTLFPVTSLPEQLAQLKYEQEGSLPAVPPVFSPAAAFLHQEQDQSMPTISQLSEMPNPTENILNQQRSEKPADIVFPEQSENLSQIGVLPRPELVSGDLNYVPEHQHHDEEPIVISTQPARTGQSPVPALSELVSVSQMPLVENPEHTDASINPEVPAYQKLSQVPPLPFSVSEPQKPEGSASSPQPEPDIGTVVHQSSFQNTRESDLGQVTAPAGNTQVILEETPDLSQIHTRPEKPGSTVIISPKESAEQLLLDAGINQGNQGSLAARENHSPVLLEDIRQESPQISPGVAREASVPIEKKVSHDSEPAFKDTRRKSQDDNKLLQREGSEPEIAEPGELFQSDLNQPTLKDLEAHSKGHTSRNESSPSLPISSPEVDLPQQPDLEKTTKFASMSKTELTSLTGEVISGQAPVPIKAEAVLLTSATPKVPGSRRTQVLPPQQDYEGLQSQIQVSTTGIQSPDCQSVTSGPLPLSEKTESLEPTSYPSNVKRQLQPPDVAPENSIPPKTSLNSDTQDMISASLHSSESGDNVKITISEEEKSRMEDEEMEVQEGYIEGSEYEERRSDISEEKGNLPLWEIPAVEHFGKTSSIWLPDSASVDKGNFPPRSGKNKSTDPPSVHIQQPHDEVVSQKDLQSSSSQIWNLWYPELQVPGNKALPQSSSSISRKKRGLHSSSSTGKLLGPLQVTSPYTPRRLAAPRTTWTALPRPGFLSPGTDKRPLGVGLQNPRPIIHMKMQKNPYEADWNKHVFQQYFGLTANVKSTLLFPTLTLRKPDSRHSSSQHIALRDIERKGPKAAKERLFLKQLKESR